MYTLQEKSNTIQILVFFSDKVHITDSSDEEIPNIYNTIIIQSCIPV